MLEVRTGSRLHFGLLELAPDQPLRFGGLGLMIEQPLTVLHFRTAMPEDHSTDEIASRIAALVAEHEGPPPRRPTGTRLFPELVSPQRLHQGLGFGTQLACATVAGLQLCDLLAGSTNVSHLPQRVAELSSELSCASPQGLKRDSGRGKRSAIGLHGFLYGGLILDKGQTAASEAEQIDPGPTQRSSSLATEHVVFPPQWRIVVIIARESSSISGDLESRLIEAAATRTNRHREQMLCLARECLTSATQQDFYRFASTVERYTQFASNMFEEVQGGLYRSPAIEHAVHLARSTGLRGVGQSSWGPAVFGFAPDVESAGNASAELDKYTRQLNWDVLVTRPSTGARWQLLEQ